MNKLIIFVNPGKRDVFLKKNWLTYYKLTIAMHGAPLFEPGVGRTWSDWIGLNLIGLDWIDFFWSDPIRSSFWNSSIRSGQSDQVFKTPQSDQVNPIKFYFRVNPIRSIRSSFFFWSIRSDQSDQVFFTAQSDQVNPIRFFQVGLPTPGPNCYIIFFELFEQIKNVHWP